VIIHGLFTDKVDEGHGAGVRNKDGTYPAVEGTGVCAVAKFSWNGCKA